MGKTSCTHNRTTSCSALDSVNAYSLLSRTGSGVARTPWLPPGLQPALLALINCGCVSSATFEPGVVTGDRKKLSAPLKALRVLCGTRNLPTEIGGWGLRLFALRLRATSLAPAACGGLCQTVQRIGTWSRYIILCWGRYLWKAMRSAAATKGEGLLWQRRGNNRYWVRFGFIVPSCHEEGGARAPAGGVVLGEGSTDFLMDIISPDLII